VQKDEEQMITIEVNIPTQTMQVLKAKKRIKEYSISTAKKGLGEIEGSEQTPRGWHIIRAKIGAHQPINTVFIGRRPSGEIYHPRLREKFPQRDWILTRILWLSGIELHKNRLGKVDTMRRYIYIHGSPDDVQMGIPGSKGCIRMYSQHIIELFALIPPYTRILLKE
jgi:lipoprotein-anchoring transpeptidase ErfK/SrfK